MGQIQTDSRSDVTGNLKIAAKGCLEDAYGSFGLAELDRWIPDPCLTLVEEGVERASARQRSLLILRVKQAISVARQVAIISLVREPRLLQQAQVWTKDSSVFAKHYDQNQSAASCT